MKEKNHSLAKSVEEHPKLWTALLILSTVLIVVLPMVSRNSIKGLDNTIESMKSYRIKNAQKYKWELNGEQVKPTKQLLKEFKDGKYGYETYEDTITMYDIEHEPASNTFMRVLTMMLLVSFIIGLALNSIPIILAAVSDIKRYKDNKTCTTCNQYGKYNNPKGGKVSEKDLEAFQDKN